MRMYSRGQIRDGCRSGDESTPPVSEPARVESAATLDDTEPPPSWTRRDTIAVLASISLALLVFVQVVHFPFVNWDDPSSSRSFAMCSRTST